VANVLLSKQGQTAWDIVGGEIPTPRNRWELVPTKLNFQRNFPLKRTPKVVSLIGPNIIGV
jgi:hypothetical protein